MSGGTSFASRLAVLMAAMLVLACALAAALNYAKFERLLLAQQTKVLTILAEDIAEALEQSMALGMRLAAVPGAQALIDRRRARERLIDGVRIADSRGEILFDTDRQRIGLVVAEVVQRPGGGAWQASRPGMLLFGAPLMNSFGQQEGTVIVEYRRVELDARLEAILASMVQAALLAVFVAVPLGTVAIFLAARRARRWFAALETALDPRAAAPPPEAAAFRATIAAAEAELAAVERSLETLAAAAPPPAGAEPRA